MYRRQTSGRFIVLTTAGIVVVMSIFTWVMYGMAQQVYIMTETMLEMNAAVVRMVDIQERMAADMGGMHDNLLTMNDTVHTMGGSVEGLDRTLGGLNSSVATMTGNVQAMTASVTHLTGLMGGMRHDVGRASHAFSQPMSYMWGNMFPF